MIISISPVLIEGHALPGSDCHPRPQQIQHIYIYRLTSLVLPHRPRQAFTIIDQNRDGIISKDDLRDVLATMGQLNVKNEELEAMVKEASGPINFTVFLTMFGEKLKGTSMRALAQLKPTLV